MSDSILGILIGAFFGCLFTGAIVSTDGNNRVVHAIACMAAQTTATSTDAQAFCSDLLDVNVDNKK